MHFTLPGGAAPLEVAGTGGPASRPEATRDTVNRRRSTSDPRRSTVGAGARRARRRADSSSPMVRVLTAFSGYTASSDNAANELTVRDVGSHLVLLGPFSRHGWSHPGPAFAYLMAVPYRLFGSDSAAMLVGALLINGVAIATMVVLARRWGGARARRRRRARSGRSSP